MLSDDLALVLNAFTLTLLPAIDAECPRPIRASARVCRDNLADILDRLREMERSTGPMPAAEDGKVVQLRRRPRLVPPPRNPGGGDAA
ncbi:MAG: hypothetical protein LDL39_12805 [Magnetospirillum sp.]|nr:hypothetical protein [Magnetospirillum sp.]